MKKFFTLLFMVSLILVSCDKSEEETLCQLTVQLTSDTEEIPLAGFDIKVKDLKSGTLMEPQKSTEKGIAVFNVAKGQYDITAEFFEGEDCLYYGSQENLTVSSSTTATIKVLPLKKPSTKTFVLDELYFNGNNNGGYDNTYYEQYFTIRNVSDRALYADGLSFGITGDFNSMEELNKMHDLLPDVVVLSQMYTLPGDGTTYKVEPGESLVIAFSAVNHKEGGEKPNSLDLSGADFEIYIQGAMTADNPEVPNVIVNFSTFQAFQWQYSGASPILLFRLDEDAASFIEKNKEVFPNPASMGMMDQDFIKLPSKYIIDAVETSVADNLYHKVLPTEIDKSSIAIPGTGMLGDGFYGHFVQRKAAAEGYVLDTNDSANDFELITGGAKNYPKK